MITTAHVFLRKLRAVARSVQGGTQADIPGLVVAFAEWQPAAREVRGRIRVVLRDVRASMIRRDPAQALTHLAMATMIVDQERKTTAPAPAPSGLSPGLRPARARALYQSAKS